MTISYLEIDSAMIAVQRHSKQGNTNLLTNVSKNSSRDLAEKYPDEQDRPYTGHSNAEQYLEKPRSSLKRRKEGKTLAGLVRAYRVGLE